MPEGQHLAKCSGDTKRTEATNKFEKYRPVAAFIYISGNSDATTRQFTRHVTTTHHPSPNTLRSHPPPSLGIVPRGGGGPAVGFTSTGRGAAPLSSQRPTAIPAPAAASAAASSSASASGKDGGGSDVEKNNIGFQGHRRICLHQWQSANLSPLIVYMVVLYFALPVAPHG